MVKLFNRKRDRTRTDYGKHPNDFEHRCCFREQIAGIGNGTQNGNGEVVEVAMRSGKIGLFNLYSERYNYTFEDTGQKNWRYHFIGYATPSNKKEEL